jgi:uncharacterized protein (DUF433 family)
MNYSPCINIGSATERAVAAVRNVLSLKEVVVLADVPEKRVRKDIETGLLAEPRIVRLRDSRLAFNWYYVLTVAAVYGNDHLNGKMRKLALSKLDKLGPSIWRLDRKEWQDHNCWYATGFVSCPAEERERLFLLDIDHYLTLNLDRVMHNVSPRMKVYCAGLSRTDERDDILGGEAVFKNTRLSVMHVGKMVQNGELVGNILEDYPYLNEDDVRFASLYYRAHPAVGRPRASDEAEYDEVDAG